MAMLTNLPDWMQTAEASSDTLSADAERAVIAARAAANLDADTLRSLAADIGEDRLDQLLALSGDRDLPENGRDILASALEGSPKGASARALIEALIALPAEEPAT